MLNIQNTVRRGLSLKRFAHYFVGSDIHLDTKDPATCKGWLRDDNETNPLNSYSMDGKRHRFGRYPQSPGVEQDPTSYTAANKIYSAKDNGVLLLPGDISTVSDPELRPMLSQCAKKFNKVLFVPGNHEYFAGSRELTIAEIEKIMRSAVTAPNVHYLSKDTVDIDGQRILGTPLWSYIDERVQSGFDFQRAFSRMRTACYHRDTLRPPTIEEMNDWHLREVRWLETQLDKARKEQRQCIVMTHHSPSFDPSVFPKKHADNPNRFLFATDLDELLQKYNDTISLWVFGHTHHACDAVVNGVRLVSNPCGYGFGNGFALKSVGDL